MGVRTAIISGFGLLTEDLNNPALKILDVQKINKTEFLHGI